MIPIKGANTIFEYAIRRWLLEQGFAMVEGNTGKLTGRNNDILILVHEPDTRSVSVQKS